MQEAMSSGNDRLRSVAYAYFEQYPDRSMIPRLLELLDKEDGEFVRPGLIRALAALGDDPRVAPALVREAGRGEDFFRSAVIEALGDHKATYAIAALTAIANLDGPLTDDAALALGKVGDPRAIDTLATLQRNGPQSRQPIVGASLCLLGVQCVEQERYLLETLSGNGESQGGIRAAAAGLAALAVSGRAASLQGLFDNAGARDPIRAPIALAAATVALRNTELTFVLLEQDPRADRIALLAEGFDMLEEDLEKERFFAMARKAYWNAPDGSTTRALMQTLMGSLDF
jgi:HEAT repeat protein